MVTEKFVNALTEPAKLADGVKPLARALPSLGVNAPNPTSLRSWRQTVSYGYP